MSNNNLLRTLALSSVSARITKIILLGGLCLMSIVSNAQFVTIPDPGFVTWLNAHGYAACMSGNQMDTTCAAVTGATTLDCSNSYVRDITGIQYFDGLNSLYCDHDSLSFLPPLPPNLFYLACGYNQLTSLPALPLLLGDLHCYSNPHLTALPALPPSVYWIDCSYDSLTILPPLPNGLAELHCSQNYLDSLPALPATLQTLECNFNQITSLPPFPVSLGWLNCNSNLLSVLAPLPDTLVHLECEFNSLTVIPSLPDSVTYFVCDNNLLHVLPVLPAGLKYLVFGYNPIDSFPLLPTGLVQLDFQNIGATSMPALPPGLQVLACSDNALYTLPALSHTLTFLVAQFCQLTDLPELPDTMNMVFVRHNPNLHCLPKLKRINTLDFTFTGVTCLPDYGYVNSSSPALNTVPLCGANNTYGCPAYWNISGNTYYDGNNNCVKDANDTAQQNVKVFLRSGGNLVEQVLTGGEGLYSFDNDSLGIYEVSVDTANIPFYVSCPVNNLFTDTITTIDSFKYDNNFALECKPGFDLAAQSIYGFPFRAANFTTLSVHAGDLSAFYGVHCAAGVSGNVTVTITGPVKYISPAVGAVTPTNVTGNVLTYNVADFGTANFFSDFSSVLQTDTTAQIGDVICAEVLVTPTAGDNNPGNNFAKQCFSVVGSFDPNEKEVSPVGNAVAGDWLTYTIHFQNTGNAEAQNIHVTDTLDANLDASTFQLLAYSFQPTVQVKENAVRFNFNNINLPDSNTNEPASHGYVQYKVKLKDNLPLGTHISNTAFIYFDFNAPVVTNTASNTISTATGIKDFGLRIFDFGLNPNPANSSFTVSVDESMIGSKLSITDITGRELMYSAVQIRNPKFAIQNFSSGVYFVTIENEQGRSTKKLVIER